MGTPRKPMTTIDAIACAIGEQEGFSSVTVMKKNFRPHAERAAAIMWKGEAAISRALIANGWVPHTGEPCPIDPDSYPNVLLADGTPDCERASDFDWDWSNAEYPDAWVIAYKPEPV